MRRYLFLILFFFLLVFSYLVLPVTNSYACSVDYSGALSCSTTNLTGCEEGFNPGEYINYDCHRDDICGIGAWSCSATQYSNAVTCGCLPPPPPPVGGKCSYNGCTPYKTCSTMGDQPVCPDGSCGCYENECRDGVDSDCDSRPPSCFLEGTKIDTPEGFRNIEDIRSGDFVYSFDKYTNSVVLNTVLESLSSRKTGYYIIKTVSGRTLRVTAEHPFYIGFKPNY